LNHQISAIQNYLEITPHLLTAGQPFEDQFSAIQAAGVQTVINLAHEDSWDYIPEEREIVEGLGMAYIHIPVVWESPQPEDLQAFFTAMQGLVGQSVFVHCARNMRVSAFVYLYRVRELRESREIALVDLQRIWQPNPVWQAFIDANV
jgi:protein tyrosine phosphatase (PTP) superfamily phosphohydrolase (DUF442 family)